MILFSSSELLIEYEIQEPNKVSGKIAVITKISTEMEKVELPESINGYFVSTIDIGAMKGNKYVKELILPAYLRRIEHIAFENCVNLKKVIFPETLVMIDYRAFAGCKSLTDVILPDKMSQIEMEAFADCEKIEQINIPDSIYYTGSNILRGTSYAKNPKNWDNGLLYNGKHLVQVDNEKVNERVDVRENTKTVASHVFAGCEKVRQIILPEGLISIGYKAFEDCPNLSYVWIPDSVGELDYDID